MREEAIVEVMVDLLLEMEGIPLHEGLVYVLDKGLESYPVSVEWKHALFTEGTRVSGNLISSGKAFSPKGYYSRHPEQGYTIRRIKVS